MTAEHNGLLIWLDNVAQILQWLVVMWGVATAAMRVKWLRQAIRGVQNPQTGIQKHWNTAIACVVFGMLAIMGNHSRLTWSHSGTHLSIMQLPATSSLIEKKPTVSLRDLMVLVAGFSNGPVVGLGSGLIAGVERFGRGGEGAISSFYGTVLLGWLAGLVYRFRRKWIETIPTMIALSLCAAIIKELVRLCLRTDQAFTKLLVWETSLPIFCMFTVGCLIFLKVFNDQEAEREDQAKQQAELRALAAEKQAHEARLTALKSELQALRAKVEPHFLKNTLHILNSFILKDPDKARDYVCDLATFLKYTQEFAEYGTISLQQELAQLQRYLRFQNLCLNDQLQVKLDAPEHLLKFRVLPMCLVTLAENAIIHGFEGHPAPYALHISVKEQGTEIVVSVSDDGKGILPERLIELGNRPVQSNKKHGTGVALHQLAKSLELEFGTAARLSFENALPKGTVAMLSYPKQIYL